MKTIATAALAVTLLSGTAYAADLIVEEPAAPVYSTPAVDWNGFYVGINGGYAGGTFEHPFEITDGIDPVLDGSLDVTAGGFVGGVQAGYNMQMDSILLGVEGDIQGSSVDGRISLDGTIDLGGGPVDFSADAGTRLNYFGTLRGRVGVVMDNAVIYGTGGFAYGQTTSSIGLSIDGTGVFDESIDNDRWGYTVGAGIEYALTDSLTFKTEYLYTDLGTENILDLDFGGGDATLDSSVAFHTVRAGLNFQF